MSNLFSIIIPTYNRKDKLIRCIKSVLANQNANYEIIVIDDGSTDTTKEVVTGRYPQIRYYYQKNKGVSCARNKGMELTKGDYIAFLDSDDLWYPLRLDIIQRAFDMLPDNVGLVYNNMDKVVDGKGDGKSFADNYFGVGTCRRADKLKHSLDINHPNKLFNVLYGHFFNTLFERNIIPPSCAVIRRDVYEKVGGFREDFSVAEDSEYFLRISKYYQIGYIPLILTSLEIPDNELSLSKNSNNIYKVKNTIKFISEYYLNESDSVLQRKLQLRLAELHTLLGYHYLTVSKKDKAKKCCITSFRIHPFYYKTHLTFLAALIPDGILQKLAKIKRHLL